MTYNTPDLWRSSLPSKGPHEHKYTHGHALIYGAPVLTGATRLAAEACARMGCGLVTVLATPETANIYRTALPAHLMVRDDPGWSDPRVTARLYGPGGLSTPPDFSVEIPVVLDADALNALPDKLSPHYVLTPHEGEFSRIFPDLKGSREERAQKAAARLNAHIVLKGHETVIAAPSGKICINAHTSAHLATAGTGDVLAGMITGLLARNMPVFEACCAAVWIHGDAAKRFGIGLVASDLPGLIPAVLKDLDV